MLECDKQTFDKAIKRASQPQNPTDIFRFTREDVELIQAALTVAAKCSQRKDLIEKYNELSVIIQNELSK